MIPLQLEPLMFVRQLRPAWFAAFALSLAPLGGCEKHGVGDDHDHSSHTAAPTDEHGEHDPGDEIHAGEEHADEVWLTPEAIERYGVRVESARRRVLRPTLAAPARVAFNGEAMAHVGSPLRGRVVELKVRLGDTVSAGQTLAVIESPELGEAQAEYLLKRTAAESSAPAVELAGVAWERARGLHERSQGVSLTEVQRREAESRAAIAAQRAAEAAANASENRLHLLGMTQREVAALVETGEITPRHAIRAAIDGAVVRREITLGELVGPDRESLMILADTRTLWVLAEVPEARLFDIKQGARAWVTIGTISPGSTAAPAHGFEGVVSFIAPFVDAVTRTARVRIEAPVDDGALKPGMFAHAEIELTPGDAGVEPIVAVPDEAVMQVEGAPAVFVPVANEPGVFARRAVTIGRPVGGMVPIHGGLLEGESVVVAGTFILKAELGKGAAAHEH